MQRAGEMGISARAEVEVEMKAPISKAIVSGTLDARTCTVQGKMCSALIFVSKYFKKFCFSFVKCYNFGQEPLSLCNRDRV